MKVVRRYLTRGGKPLTLRELDSIPGDPIRAYSRLNAAKARGDIVAPESCSKCGKTSVRIFGHHDSYDRPLDVTWLCAGCHSARHVEIRLANAKSLGVEVVESRVRGPNDPNKGACLLCNSRAHDRRRCPLTRTAVEVL
jgi:hypothetical protein